MFKSYHSIFNLSKVFIFISLFLTCQPLKIDLLCDMDSKTFQAILALKIIGKDESSFCGYKPVANTSASATNIPPSSAPTTPVVPTTPPPTVNSFTIGGTITGLSGSLILTNNSTDIITVTQNGAFTFTQQLANNTSYAVTVTTNPVNQGCSIGNASGIVQNANVTNVNITCAGNSKTLTAINIPSLSITGTFNGLGVIMIAPPTTTNLTGLIPTFSHTGVSVTVNGTAITSGISAVDFTNPVSFTVVAADGSTQVYTVAVYAPRAISGIGLWLRADSMALANGASVNPWNDSSGNGNNFPSSGSATFQSAVINGLPVVRIAGFGFGLGAGTPTGLYVNDSGSFFSVSKLNGAPGAAVSILTLGGCPNGGRGFIFQGTTGKLSVTRYCNADNLVFNTSPGFTNFRIHSILQNGTSLVNGYLDGNLDATNNTIIAAGQGYNNFGGGNYVYYIANSSGSTDFGNIDIAEILFYNVFLNATDMKKVNCYLSVKYALPLNGVSCP
jgi:hypothetical protein